MPEKIIISPKTKVGELLNSYPELEKVLMEMSPLFEKLKNPVLRKTVARVATLQQVAAVGGLKVEFIVNRLREELGITESGSIPDSEFLPGEVPAWFDRSRVVEKFDASPLINSGGSPMAEILHRTAALRSGEIFELQTPFMPAPIIDMLKGKGFKAYSSKDGSSFFTYFTK